MYQTLKEFDVRDLGQTSLQTSDYPQLPQLTFGTCANEARRMSTTSLENTLEISRTSHKSGLVSC